MNRALQHAIENAARRAVTKAVETAIEKQARNQANRHAQEWRGNFHTLVSGYYVGLMMKYLLIPMVIICPLLAAGLWFSGDSGSKGSAVFAAALTVLFLWLRIFSAKRMYVIVYWDGGIMFLDRKGNTLAQMPSSVLQQAAIKAGKIVIPWNGKKYKIVRHPQDNAEQVTEMLRFYGIHSSNR